MKKPAKRSPCAIIVLGMHRSGTSALMRTVNLRGVDLGSNLMPPVANNNEKGFWEHMDIFRMNEKLLENLNSSWDDVRSLPEGWWGSEAAQRYKLEIINILVRDFSKSRFWGVKDPRICRFLPIWRPLLKQIGCKPYFLIIVRNPLEVVTSLAKRDGFSQGKSCLLWLKHIIESEKGTRNTPRLFVTYEELLSDWKGLMFRTQKSFQFKWPVTLKDASPEIASFLQKSLRHNIVNDTVLIEDSTLHRWIKDLYFEIKEAVNGDDSQLIKAVTAIEAELKDAAGLYEPAVADIWTRYQANHAMLQERNQQLDDIKMRLDGSSQDKGYHLSTIDNLQTAIKKKNERIQQLDTEVVEIRDQLSTVQQAVVGREADVTHLQTANKEKNERIQQLDDELTGLRDEFTASQKALSAHEARISDLQNKVKERNSRIHELDIELVGLREEFSTLQGTVANRKAEITHLQADLEDRDDHIKQLNAESADLWKELTAYQGVVAEYGSTVDQLQAEIKERDERIQQLDAELSGLSEETAASQESLSARETEVKNLRIEIVEKDERIHELDADVGRLQDEVNAMRTQVEKSRLDLVAISGSKSWKLTSPLRWLYVKARKVKGKIKTIRYLLTKQYRLINKSDLFEAEYNSEQNPDMVEAGVNPLVHYLYTGMAQGLPCSLPRNQEESLATPKNNIDKPQILSALQLVPDWKQNWNAFLPPPTDTTNRILVVDWKPPTPDIDSGSYRMSKILACLVGAELKVDFIGDREAEEGAQYAAELEKRGIKVLVGREAAISHLLKHGMEYKAALLARPEIFEKYVSMVRAFAVNAKVLYDTVDLHWVRFARGAKVAGGNPELKAQSEFYKRLELSNARSADVCIAITEEEKKILLAEEPRLNVRILSNIHEVSDHVSAFSARRDLFFIGSFDHVPNVDAVHYFLFNVLPLVTKEMPDIRFRIVGSKMPPDIFKLASANVEPVGYVEDVEPYFQQCRVFVAPLRYGAGMKGKVGQSLSYGLPVVTTRIGAEGIGLIGGESALISDNATEFAAAVIRLYKDEALWSHLSKTGRELIKEKYSTNTVQKEILSLVE